MKKGGTIEMRGGRLYASVYCALPGTAREVSERIGVLLEPVENALRSLKALGIVHRSKIVHIGQKRVPAGYYERGEGVNAPYPRAGLKHSRPRAGAIAFASAVRAMEPGASVGEVYAETGCSPNYVRSMIAVFRQYQMAHISAWKTETKYEKAPIWKLIPGVNAPRPKAIPKRQVNVEYWQRRKQRIAAQRVVDAFASQAVQHSSQESYA